MVVIDVLCPDLNETPDEPKKAHIDEKQPSMDRSRVTQLQIINIHGEIVNVEN